MNNEEKKRPAFLRLVHSADEPQVPRVSQDRKSREARRNQLIASDQRYVGTLSAHEADIYMKARDTIDAVGKYILNEIHMALVEKKKTIPIISWDSEIPDPKVASLYIDGGNELQKLFRGTMYGSAERKHTWAALETWLKLELPPIKVPRFCENKDGTVYLDLENNSPG